MILLPILEPVNPAMTMVDDIIQSEFPFHLQDPITHFLIDTLAIKGNEQINKNK